MRRLLVAAALGALLAGAPPAAAEEPALRTVPGGSTADRAEVLLTLPHEAPLRPLTASDLVVTVDGTAQEVTVSPVPAAQVDVAVVLDPALPAPVRDHARAGAADLLRGLPDGARAVVVAEVASQPLGAPATALAQLAAQAPPSGPDLTALVRAAGSDAAVGGPGRQPVVLVVAAARSAASGAVPVSSLPLGTLCHAIVVGDGGVDYDRLEDLVATTGGRAEHATADSLGRAFDELDDELQRRWSLVFTPTAALPRTVTVALAPEWSGLSSDVLVSAPSPRVTGTGAVTTGPGGASRPWAALALLALGLVAAGVVGTLAWNGRPWAVAAVRQPSWMLAGVAALLLVVAAAGYARPRHSPPSSGPATAAVPVGSDVACVPAPDDPEAQGDRQAPRDVVARRTPDDADAAAADAGVSTYDAPTAPAPVLSAEPGFVPPGLPDC